MHQGVFRVGSVPSAGSGLYAFEDWAGHWAKDLQLVDLRLVNPSSSLWSCFSGWGGKEGMWDPETCLRFFRLGKPFVAHQTQLVIASVLDVVG